MSVAIGKRLSALRKEAKLTQKDVFKLTGIDSVTLSKYENGGQEPGTENLKKLTQALNTTADYILFGNGEKESPYNKKDLQSKGYKIAYALINLFEEGLIHVETQDYMLLTNKYKALNFLWNYIIITNDIDANEKGYSDFIETKIKKYADSIDQKTKK